MTHIGVKDKTTLCFKNKMMANLSKKKIHIGVLQSNTLRHHLEPLPTLSTFIATHNLLLASST